MRLIKSQHVREAEAPTPASAIAEKYDWLLRWAMHFTQSDRAVAEDLVQDTFVRLIVAWPKIKDNIEQVEPFLYSTLKYAHLMELRRGRRFNFQDLALIEFDDLRLSLKEEKSADPIEVQDDLRRIVAYLCWRKRAVKSASILLLRFFHGYFPEEIARIALMKRGSTDELLRVAREEVKSYLADPSRVEIMQQGKAPELMPRMIAVPQERFADELRTTIYQSQSTPCLSREQLTQRYQAVDAKPINVDLLAHLVSCEQCLSAINSIFNFPSHSDGIASSSRRSKRGSGPDGKASAEEIRRCISGGMERFRALYEHHPRGLMIAVNGDVIAMRDVNSATSELKVQTAPDKSLGIIDVLSEQGLTLLTLYVPSGPPEAPPEVRHEIALSDNRKLELLLRFTSEGAVIELHYNDPLFLSAPAHADLEELADDASVQSPERQLAVADAGRPRQSWWRRIFGRIAEIPMPEMSPLLATAMLCGLTAVVLFMLSVHRSSVMKPAELLSRATASAAAPMKTGGKGVVVQTVRIQAPSQKLERTVYHDIEGRRHPKTRAPESGNANLQATLAEAGVNWDDPLSPTSFSYWHEHGTASQDVVTRSGTGLLTLTTTVANGAVASESLTVREADFHTVGKTIALRGQGTIEIAEVSYGVFPWNSVNPDLFDPVSLAPSTFGSGTHAAILPHLGMPLTAMQLDEAELAARLALNHLQVDDNNQISLLRQPDGIHVQGIVADEQEKHKLQTELRMVPHVLTSILTVDEMDTQPATASAITSIRQTSLTAAEPSSLEKLLTEKGIGPDKAGPLAQQLVDSSFSANHESKALTELLERFAQNDQLSPAARTSLSQLLVQHKAALLKALQEEEQQLTALGLAPNVSNAATGPVQNDADALRVAAEHNFSLCMELTSGTSASARPAQSIVPQLVASIAQLRTVTLRISAASQLYTPSTNATATNHESR